MSNTGDQRKQATNLFDPPKTAYINDGLEGVDGNAYAVLGHFRKQALSQDWSAEDIAKVLTEAQTDDYEYLLATILKHIESD